MDRIKKESLVNIVFVTSVLLVALSLFSVSFVGALAPTGGSTSFIRSSTAPNDTAGSNNAIAGNVTEMNVFGYSTTQSWQGYYGNITGTIQLADGSDNVFYNWSLASPQGEIYASTNQTISWLNVQCFNFTARGNLSTGLTGETAGGTNVFGMNMSQLETQYGILWDDVDGVNETFSLLGAGTHDQFFTANLQFSGGECQNTRVFSASGGGVNDQFEEALLYEPSTGSVIFTSILDENVQGFDSAYHDFEMLVLENGHGTDTSTTTYYFFVELE